MEILLIGGWFIWFLLIPFRLYRRWRVSRRAEAMILSIRWSTWRKIRDTSEGFLVLSLLPVCFAYVYLEDRTGLGAVVAISVVTVLLWCLYVYEILKWPYFLAFHKQGVVIGSGTKLVKWHDISTWEWNNAVLLIRQGNGRPIVCRIPRELREDVVNVLSPRVHPRAKNASHTA